MDNETVPSSESVLGSMKTVVSAVRESCMNKTLHDVKDTVNLTDWKRTINNFVGTYDFGDHYFCRKNIYFLFSLGKNILENSIAQSAVL